MKFRSAAMTFTAAASAAALVLTGCTTTDDGGDDDSILFWVQEDLPDRVAATQEIVDAFIDETGIEVEMVSVAEDQFSQLITA